MFPQKCIGQTLLIEASRPPLSNPKFAANYQVFFFKWRKIKAGKWTNKSMLNFFSSSWLTKTVIATEAANSDQKGGDKTIQKQTECKVWTEKRRAFYQIKSIERFEMKNLHNKNMYRSHLAKRYFVVISMCTMTTAAKERNELSMQSASDSIQEKKKHTLQW